MDIPAVQLLCLEQGDHSLKDHTRDLIELANLTTFLVPGKLVVSVPQASLLENNGLYFSVCSAKEDISSGSPTPNPEPSQPPSLQCMEQSPKPTVT